MAATRRNCKDEKKYIKLRRNIEEWQQRKGNWLITPAHFCFLSLLIVLSEHRFVLNIDVNKKMWPSVLLMMNAYVC